MYGYGREEWEAEVDKLTNRLSVLTGKTPEALRAEAVEEHRKQGGDSIGVRSILSRWIENLTTVVGS